jgi:8-oxo-dGTP pyrophosphatase MutT (NUDIX family)
VEGLARRLGGILTSYARIAWWGLFAPRLGARRPLWVHQGVVLGERGVLLGVRRDLRGWELPGGAALAGESGEDAVRREIVEETGLRVAVERRVGDYVRTGFRPHTARVYACRYVSGEPRASSETLTVGWFDPHRLPDTLFPWYRGPIADALAAGGEPVVRHEHQGAAAVLAGMAIDLRMRFGRGSDGR